MRFLDNVLSDYIARAPDEMARAKYSAPSASVSVGLGVMGFHSFLQARGLPFEGAMAKAWNLKIFKHIRAQVDQASMMLAKERGPCPDAADMGVMERFSCKMAIAPTASISIICRRHPRLHRADPGQHLHPQDAVGQLLDQEPVSRKAARVEDQGQRQRCGTRSSSRAAASSTSTS